MSKVFQEAKCSKEWSVIGSKVCYKKQIVLRSKLF